MGNIFGRLRGIERRTPIGIIGLAVGVAFGVYSCSHQASPKLEFEPLSNSPVLDVKENLPELEVLYRGQDIAKANLSLTDLVLRIVNRGDAQILKSYYDERDPVRIEIGNATIIKAELAGASSEYLERTAAPTGLDQKNIWLAPVILEPAQYYVLKILLLHPAGRAPSIAIGGKVAGQRLLTIQMIGSAPDTPSFVEASFGGSVWVQLARAVAYFVGGILLVIILGTSLAFVTDSFAKWRRKKRVAAFKRSYSESENSAFESIYQAYVENGVGTVAALANFANSSPEKITKRIAQLKTWKRKRAAYRDIPIIHDAPFTAELALGTGLVQQADTGQWQVAPTEKVNMLQAFAAYLSAVHGPLREHETFAYERIYRLR